jgi:hypothetical protein
MKINPIPIRRHTPSRKDSRLDRDKDAEAVDDDGYRYPEGGDADAWVEDADHQRCEQHR